MKQTTDRRGLTHEESFAKELEESERQRDNDTVKRYTQYFADNALLYYFPFEKFSREQQLALAAKIENAATLHAACNLLPDAGVEVGVNELDTRKTLEWNTENIRRLQLKLSGTEPSDGYYEESSFWIASAEKFLCHILTCSNEERCTATNLIRTAKDTFDAYSLDEKKSYLIHYLHFVDDCIRAILYLGSLQRRECGYSDFSMVISEVCGKYIKHHAKCFVDSTPDIPIEEAFLHYTRFMEYLENAEVESQIQIHIFDKLNKTIAQWDKDCLEVQCSTMEDALKLGLKAIGKKARSKDRESLLKFHATLGAFHAYSLPHLNSSTWALLGYILFQCDTKELSVLQTRHDRDPRGNDANGHSKGLRAYSTKQFARDLSDGTNIEMDMRINYINEIIVLGYAIISGTDCHMMNYVVNPMHEISRSLAALFLCYNAQMAARIAGEVLELFWDSFCNWNRWNTGNSYNNPADTLEDGYRKLLAEWGIYI